MGLRLSHGEETRWLNEGLPPSEKEKGSGRPILHDSARGYLLCIHAAGCFQCLMVRKPRPKAEASRTGGGQVDPYGHGKNVLMAGSVSKASAIACVQRTDVFRLLIPVPETPD